MPVVGVMAGGRETISSASIKAAVAKNSSKLTPFLVLRSIITAQRVTSLPVPAVVGICTKVADGLVGILPFH